MRKAVFLAVITVVAGIVANYLPTPPGLDRTITFIGAVAAALGGGLAILARKVTLPHAMLSIIVAGVVFAGSLMAFIDLAKGEASPLAANELYLCATAMFAAVGFAVEIGGLKITGDG